MEIASFGGVEVRIKKGGFTRDCRWRLTGQKKWKKFPMPEELALYLETESFFNQTVPDMIKIGKMFGL